MTEDDRGEGTQIREELGKLRSEIEELAGEIRLKIHLASMDVKDSWNEVEPRIRQLQEEVNKAVSTTGSEIKAAALDLKARAKKIRDTLS